MARVYTPEQRVEALAALELNGGALRATALQVGVPAPTLQLWRDRIMPDVQAVHAAAVQKVSPEPAPPPPDYAALWADYMVAALARAQELLGHPDTRVRDASVAAG